MKIALGIMISLVMVPAFGMRRYQPLQVSDTTATSAALLASPVSRQSAGGAETKAAHAAQADQKATAAVATTGSSAGAAGAGVQAQAAVLSKEEATTQLVEVVKNCRKSATAPARIKELIVAGAEVNGWRGDARGAVDLNLLQLAIAQWGSFDTVKALIDGGADLTHKNRGGGSTAELVQAMLQALRPEFEVQKALTAKYGATRYDDHGSVEEQRHHKLQAEHYPEVVKISAFIPGTQFYKEAGKESKA